MSLWMRTTAFCVMVCVVISCLDLWYLLSEKQRVDGPFYAAHAARDNRDLSSRLCVAGSRRSVLYGVFSTAEKVLFRNTTRQQVQCGFNSNGHSTVFVVGAPSTEREHETMRVEASLYGDIFTLTCDENMNEGKTYIYFKETLQQLPYFDFYAKVDDDTAFAPARLAAVIRSVSTDMPLLVGRRATGDPTWLLFLKWIRYGFRDFSWTQHLQNYTAGMLYVLNAQAVKQWIVLNPTQFYGDEDFRTTYFMQLIGARVINLGTSFHDHIKSDSGWKLEITNASLAVHRCKSPQMLSDAFASLCVTQEVV